MTKEEVLDIKTTLEKIVENLFLCEPLMFATYCTYVLTINPKITVPFRSGKMRIEYNPNILEKMNFEEIKKCFETEIIRVILKHPYSRKPDLFNPCIAIMASEVTIHQELAEKLELPPSLSYEQYYSLMRPEEIIRKESETKKKFEENHDSSGNNKEENGKSSVPSFADDKKLQNLLAQAYDAEYGATGLWEENDIAMEELNSLIKDYAARGEKSWGSLEGHLKDQILASLNAKIDYRKVLKNFRASILSEKKHLTRFKPSRRFGFEYMGSKREFTTKLLLAIDTSGSISNQNLKNFYGVINKFFKYGIESIDVLNFDCELQGEPVSFKKRQTAFNISGRGGTDFQPVFDYAKDHPEYDGVIILTDGYADHPQKKPGTKAKFVWVLPSEAEYNEHKDWMKQTGKSCFLTVGKVNKKT
ncbi:MAG: VWA-like domain-containing protein [Treponema sp.]|nr:VWA-like domain-containing protein [Treponema sp.]MDY5838306.1 VWA-like domain-containing protein [Treponema sp.]